MGGAAAIDFTLTYPEVVHKLVLIDSAGVIKGLSTGSRAWLALQKVAVMEILVENWEI